MNSPRRHREFPIRANGTAVAFRRITHATAPIGLFGGGERFQQVLDVAGETHLVTTLAPYRLACL